MHLSRLVTFDASPICVRTIHDKPGGVLRVNKGYRRLAISMHDLYAGCNLLVKS